MKACLQLRDNSRGRHHSQNSTLLPVCGATATPTLVSHILSNACFQKASESVSSGALPVPTIGKCVSPPNVGAYRYQISVASRLRRPPFVIRVTSGVAKA